MSLTTPPDKAERQAALRQLPAVRLGATRRRRRRTTIRGAAVLCLVLVAVVSVLVVTSGGAPCAGPSQDRGRRWPPA